MREPSPGEADTPRPAKKKKRMNKSTSRYPKPKKAKIQKLEADSMASTRETAESFCAEVEESDDCALALSGRRSVVASKSAEPKASELEAAGTEAAEVVLTRAEGTVKRGSYEVPGPTNDRNTSGAEGHLVDKIQETNNEASQKVERIPVELFEAIDVDEPLLGPSFSLRQIRHAQYMKTLVVGASLE